MTKKTKPLDLSSMPGHVSIRARGASRLPFTVMHLAAEGLLPKKYITQYTKLSDSQAQKLIDSLKNGTKNTTQDPARK